MISGTTSSRVTKTNAGAVNLYGTARLPRLVTRRLAFREIEPCDSPCRGDQLLNFLFHQSRRSLRFFSQKACGRLWRAFCSLGVNAICFAAASGSTDFVFAGE